MITTLNDQACLDLLATGSVGRFGFVRDGRVLIIPVTYRYDGSDIIVRTGTEGVLAGLPDENAPVTFEVDYHDPNRGVGWSVLMHGSVTTMDDDEVAASPAARGLVPWAGGDRPRYLRYRIAAVSGRRVRREDGHASG